MLSIRSLLGTSGTNLAVVGISTIGGIVMARFMQPDERGAYAAAFVWMTLLQIVTERGYFGAIVHGVASAPSARRTIYGFSLSRVLLTSVPVGLIGTAVVVFVVPENSGKGALVSAMLMLPLTTAAMTALFALYGTSVVAWNRVRLIQAAIYLTAIATLAVLDRISPLACIWAAMGSVAAGGGVSSVLFLTANWNNNASSDRNDLRAYARTNYSWQLPTIANNRIDQLALSVIAANAVLGNYAIAVAYGALILPATTAIGHVAFPALSSLRSNQAVIRRDMIRRAVKLSLVVGTFAACVAAAGAPLVIPLVFGEQYQGAVILAVILAPAVWGAAIRQVMSDILRGVNNQKPAARMEIGALLVSLVLLPPAIILGGAIGAACVMAIISFSSATTLLMVVRKYVAATVS